MKIVAVILSVFFLCLNFVSCSDAETGSSEEKTQTYGAAENNSDTIDLCSPFCQCHCCHIHTIDFKVAEIEIFIPKISEDNFSHFEKRAQYFQSSILQPPRI